MMNMQKLNILFLIFVNIKKVDLKGFKVFRIFYPILLFTQTRQNLGKKYSSKEYTKLPLIMSGSFLFV